jgi:hypothetical protein
MLKVFPNVGLIIVHNVVSQSIAIKLLLGRLF